MTNYEAQKNITMFLLSIKYWLHFRKWKGKMKAAEQRELFGHYFGKGIVVINGETDTITHDIKVEFGRDTCETGRYELVTGYLSIGNEVKQNQKQGVI